MFDPGRFTPLIPACGPSEEDAFKSRNNEKKRNFWEIVCIMDKARIMSVRRVNFAIDLR